MASYYSWQNGKWKIRGKPAIGINFRPPRSFGWLITGNRGDTAFGGWNSAEIFTAFTFEPFPCRNLPRPLAGHAGAAAIAETWITWNPFYLPGRGFLCERLVSRFTNIIDRPQVNGTKKIRELAKEKERQGSKNRSDIKNGHFQGYTRFSIIVPPCIALAWCSIGCGDDDSDGTSENLLKINRSI